MIGPDEITIELGSPTQMVSPNDHIATEEEVNNDTRLMGYGIVLSPNAPD